MQSLKITNKPKPNLFTSQVSPSLEAILFNGWKPRLDKIKGKNHKSFNKK